MEQLTIKVGCELLEHLRASHPDFFEKLSFKSCLKWDTAGQRHEGAVLAAAETAVWMA